MKSVERAEQRQIVIRALNKHRARFLVIGGVALQAYGHSRTTADLDLFVEPTMENGKRICEAIRELGFPMVLDEFWFVRPRPLCGIKLKWMSNSFDLVTEIDAVTFDEAWANKVLIQIGQEMSFMLSHANLIKNKQVCMLKPGRERDIADLNFLNSSCP